MRKVACALLLLLSACKQNKSGGVEGQILLGSVPEVNQWVIVTQKSFLEQGGKEPSQKSQRLLNMELLLSPMIFLTDIDGKKVNKKHFELEVPFTNHYALADEVHLKLQPFERTGMPSAIQAENLNIGLSKANQEDIRYVGQIARENVFLAMVKVGERLYTVKTGDLIGLGQWHVESIDSDLMLLRIGSKVVGYDKN